MNKKLILVVNRYIKNTPRKGYVKDLRIKICEIPHRLKSKIKTSDERVYVTTKSLKHMYDMRPAQEFDLIVTKMEEVIIQPLRIYKNKEGKKGTILPVTGFYGAGRSTYLHRNACASRSRAFLHFNSRKTCNQPYYIPSRSTPAKSHPIVSSEEKCEGRKSSFWMS